MHNNPESPSDLEDEFLKQAKNALDQTVDELDPSTLARLNEIRFDVLATEKQTLPWMQWVRVSGFGSVAMASLVAVFLLFNPMSVGDFPNQDGESVALQFEESLSGSELSDEEIDLLENIDFVAWLIEQDDHYAG